MNLSQKSRFFEVKGLYADTSDRYIRPYYSGWRFRTQPEVVVYACDKYPELKEHIDYKYYKQWLDALSRTKKNIPKRKLDFKVKPFPHQEMAINFALSLPCSCLFMEPGTGKTFCALAVTEIRKKLGKVKKTLVVAPASILYTGWREDMIKFTDLTGVVISGKPFRWRGCISYKKAYKQFGDEAPKFELENNSKSIEELLDLDVDVVFTSYHTLYRNVELFEAAGFDQVILDESTMIKNPSGSFYNAAIKVSEFSKYRLCLTGTPYINSLEDLWAQMNFCDGSLDDTIGEFRGRYFKQSPDATWMRWPHRWSKDEILKRIDARCLHVPKSVLKDLPDREIRVRQVDITPKIRKHYEEMRKHLLTELESGHEVEARNKMVEVLRLHQIILGHVDGQEIDKSPKLKELKEIVDNTNEKVVVWAKYRQDFKWIKDVFPDCCVINGDTKDVQEESRKFLDPNGPKVMLAQPQSAKFGHTWNCAKTCVFYSYDYSLESYLQAQDRNYRIGQDSTVTQYILSSGGIEDLILQSLRGKEDMSKKILKELLIKSQI